MSRDKRAYYEDDYELRSERRPAPRRSNRGRNWKNGALHEEIADYYASSAILPTPGGNNESLI